MNRDLPLRARAILLAALCCLTSLPVLSWGQVFPNSTISQTSDLGDNRQNGIKRSIYYVIYDETKPFTESQWNSRVNTIRSNEIETRQFFATNSGGKFDIYYDQVIAVPLALNGDGTRPSNWSSQVDTFVANTHGLSRNNFYTRIYDVNLTKPDPDQGWGGLYRGTPKDIYLQSNGVRVTNHEIGHRLAFDHAQRVDPVNDSNFTPYVWNAGKSQYEIYQPGVSPYSAAPLGSALWQYGNPFDTMGNGTGHFRLQEKFEEASQTWLTSSQVPRLDSSALGEGIHRIYAHDELQAITNDDGTYGVAKGYDPGVKYGLRYQRPGQRFETSFGGRWVNETQEMFIEYRAGTDGLGFYLTRTTGDDLDGALLDLDPRTGNSQRLLRVGSSVEDTEMGMSRFFVPAGAVDQDTPNVDFLSYSPLPPTLRADEWFHFAPLGTGSDSIGSYIDLKVTKVARLNGIAGDLDQSGEVDEADLARFIEGWRTDTSMLTSTQKYWHGDLNFDGITDLYDAGLFRSALKGAGLNMAGLDGLAAVPEPATLTTLLVGAMAAVYGYRRRRTTILRD